MRNVKVREYKGVKKERQASDINTNGRREDRRKRTIDREQWKRKRQKIRDKR